jgi:hypothetical protein
MRFRPLRSAGPRGEASPAGAPDYVEPVVAWRTWCVVETDSTVRLRSVVHETVWSPCVALDAQCLYHGRVGHEAPSPSAACTCGIYGARDLVAALEYVFTPSTRATIPNRVIGRVSLWGRVLESDGGWRAEHAYPERLLVAPAREDADGSVASEVARKLSAYRVPVEGLQTERGHGMVATLVDATRHLATGSTGAVPGTV